MDLRHALDALRIERAVVYALGYAGTFECGVGVLLPRFAPRLQQRFGVPVAHLRAESIRPDGAHGELHMSVKVAVVTFAARCMQAHIGNHAGVDELALDKLADQVEPLALTKF